MGHPRYNVARCCTATPELHVAETFETRNLPRRPGFGRPLAGPAPAVPGPPGPRKRPSGQAERSGSGAGAERERSGRFVRAAREGGLGKGSLHTHRAASLTTIPNKRRHDNNAQSRRLRSKPNAVLLLYYYCTIARTLHDAQTRSLVLCAVVLCVARATVTGKRKTRKVEYSKNLVETEKRENSNFRIFEFSRVARARMSGRRKTRKVENSKILV